MQAHPLRSTAASGSSIRTSLPAFATTPAAAVALHTSHSHMRLLVVDEDAGVRNACAEIAASMGFQTVGADSIAAARQALQAHAVDVLLFDMKAPASGGSMRLLEEVRKNHPRTTVLVMTAFATVTSAVEAMRTGASDYLTKPFSLEELVNLLERSAAEREVNAEARALRQRLQNSKGMGNMVGQTAEMQKLYRIVSKVAFTTHPVLILGESGTGKELVARSIHFNGPNANKPFVPVDCGSLVPTLIESELFGHVKGAFTGANRTRDGLLTSAAGGTVFLDEIGELPLDLQARLLRALQEKEVRPVGATHAVPMSARVLAATNRDLAGMVESGKFRKDLFFRLNVVSLRVPPLRDRPDDIPLLIAHTVERMRRETGTAYSFSDDALRLMTQYNWPGNVRELEHAIERACALSSGPLLHLADFPTQLQNHRAADVAARAEAGAVQVAGAGGTSSAPAVLSIAEMEKQAILAAITQLRGDKLMAARMLGIGKTTLYRKLKEYGLEEQTVEG